MRNKNSNAQGSSPNVVKVLLKFGSGTYGLMKDDIVIIIKER